MAKSNQGHTMTFHTYTPQPMSLSTSFTLQFLRYSLDKFVPITHLPANPDTMGENNTPTAFKWGNKRPDKWEETSIYKCQYICTKAILYEYSSPAL